MASKARQILELYILKTSNKKNNEENMLLAHEKYIFWFAGKQHSHVK